MFHRLLLSALALCLVGCGDSAPDPDPTPALTGDVARGGQLYDKWWATAEVEAPEGEHPLWAARPDKDANTRTGPTTWRCKECHGWDYKGVDGVYGGGSHRTGFPGILGSDKSAEQLTSLLKEAHGYGAAGLDDQAIADLVAFVQGGMVDTATLIDAEGKFLGDAAAGEPLFTRNIGENKRCASCHGDTGLEAPGEDADYEDWVGLIATENPWELVHKIRFGQPGTDMPVGLAADISAQQLKDLGAHCQTLPTAP